MTLDVIGNDMTDLATHVLPTAGQLERADLPLWLNLMQPVVYGQYTPAVLPLPPGRRPIWWYAGRLARALGHDVLPGRIDPGDATDDDTLRPIVDANRSDEHPDGKRWLETALVLDPIPDGAVPWSTAGVRERHDIRYALEWEPGRREIRRTELWFTDPAEGEVHIELEKRFTFRMRGIGYGHPHWAHGTSHGELETGRESIRLDDFDPLDMASLHLQNLVIARMGDRTGVGVLEQAHFGPPRADRADRVPGRVRVVATS